VAAAFPAGAPGQPEWLRAYAKIQQITDAEILRVVNTSLMSINREIAAALKAGKAGIGETVRIEQMQRIRAAMMREQLRIYTATGDIIRARRIEAALRASALGSTIDSLAFAAAGDPDTGRLLSNALTRGLEQTVEVAVTRITQSAFDLSQRIYKSKIWADGVLDRKINAALARGLTVAEFATEARDWFNPRTPGGVRYAALRLARTEVNNAYHAISVNQINEKPWSVGGQWRISGSHPKKDVCDEYAARDGFNLGPGVYPPREIPSKPHPQCLCVVTPVLPSEEDFLDSLVGGKYDEYLQRKGASVGAPGWEGTLKPGSLPRGGTSPGLPGSPDLDPKAARRAAARARNREIEAKTAIANTAADVQAVIFRAEASGTDAAYGVQQAIKDSGSHVRGNASSVLSESMEAELLDLLAATADVEKVMARLDAIAEREGLQRIGTAGTRTKYSPDVHETFSAETKIKAGDPVQIKRPGYSVQLDDGSEVFLFKATVSPITDSYADDLKRALQTIRARNEVKASQSGLRTKVREELDRQARLTPKAMQQISSVEADLPWTAEGRATIFEMGADTGADYTYYMAEQRIRLNPHWHDMFEDYDRAFSTGAAGPGHFHAPTKRPGISSTVAHEYGHHVDRVIMGARGEMSAKVAKELLDALGDGLSFARFDDAARARGRWGRKGGGRIDEADLNAWLAAHKVQAAAKVSGYGSTSIRELFAEIWTEYSTSGKQARPHIIRIGNIMKRLAEEAAKTP